MCVCVYVCVCVYMCVHSATAQTDGWIFMKFSTNDLDLTDICEVRFTQILKFPNDDVMAAIFALFRGGILTVAILLRFSSKFNTR